MHCARLSQTGVNFSTGRASIATKMRYAFGILAKDSKGATFPMLCLSDSIRHDDPCVQQLLRTIEEAQTLAQLILAVWPLARVLALHIVEYVLAERAQRPSAWPPCPTWGPAAQ